MLLEATGLVKNKCFIVSSKITENSPLKTTTLTETRRLLQMQEKLIKVTSEGSEALEAETLARISRLSDP